MLRVTKQASGYFLLDEEGTGQAIPLPHETAVKIKNNSRTPGELVKNLYDEFGNNPKYKDILDRNLKPTKGVSSPSGMPAKPETKQDNVQQLFDDFQNIVS